MKMASKYEITAAQKVEIEQARVKNKDKKVEYKLKAAQQTSEKSQRGGHSDLKKMKEKIGELEEEIHNRCGDSGKVRLMF